MEFPEIRHSDKNKVKSQTTEITLPDFSVN
jgi:hypothetical protein